MFRYAFKILYADSSTFVKYVFFSEELQPGKNTLKMHQDGSVERTSLNK